MKREVFCITCLTTLFIVLTDHSLPEKGPMYLYNDMVIFNGVVFNNYIKRKPIIAINFTWRRAKKIGFSIQWKPNYFCISISFVHDVIKRFKNIEWFNFPNISSTETRAGLNLYKFVYRIYNKVSK